jgi:hypothetical protein
MVRLKIGVAGRFPASFASLSARSSPLIPLWPGTQLRLTVLEGWVEITWYAQHAICASVGTESSADLYWDQLIWTNTHSFFRRKKRESKNDPKRSRHARPVYWSRACAYRPLSYANYNKGLKDVCNSRQILYRSFVHRKRKIYSRANPHD